MSFLSSETLDDPQVQSAIRQTATVIMQTVVSLRTEISPQWLSNMDSKVRAHVINQQVMGKCQELFQGHPTISVVDSKGLLHIVVNGAKLRVHFTSDERYRLSVNRTRQTRKWQRGERGLHGLPDPNEHFHIVFTTDPAWLAVQSIFVGVYRGPNRVAYRKVDLAYVSTDIQYVSDQTVQEDGARPQITFVDEYEQQSLDGTENENSTGSEGRTG